jgi:hypothetical protein
VHGLSGTGLNDVWAVAYPTGLGGPAPSTSTGRPGRRRPRRTGRATRPASSASSRCPTRCGSPAKATRSCACGADCRLDGGLGMR